MKASLGKFLYGAAFCLGLPALIALWSAGLRGKLGGLWAPHSLPAGAVLAAGGAALMLRGMWDLWRRGGGLPMNAYPPPRLVVSGAYRCAAHPIYLGFGLMVPGVLIALGAGAVWVVAPITWLATAALVVGFESVDLKRRLGAPVRAAWLSLAPDSPSKPTAAQRAAALAVAFTPWLVGYEACAHLPPSRAPVDTMMAFERGWPVWEWSAVAYLGVYAWTALAPLAASTQSALRRFSGTALWGTALILWCFLSFPLVAAPRPIGASSVLGRMLLFDRAHDTMACALPSFHVFWAFAAASAWGSRIGARTARLLAVLMSASCVTTGAHSILDVAAGWLAWVAAEDRGAIWARLVAAAEWVANSWRDWRIGPVRFINHGAYAGCATAYGLWLVGVLLGPDYAPGIIACVLCALIGACAWGQWLEASSQLSRPFGYFGGLFGGMIGAGVAQLAWGQGWRILGAFAVAAPLVQGVGRLRCLVQGCCHGGPAPAGVPGIRYSAALSRVCRIAKLSGVPVHPTQLYSILGNVLIIGLISRLWMEGADMAFVAGAYLMLAACARFMEECYRGEPQTVRWVGLAIYQWLGVGCLLAGIVLTTLRSPGPPPWSGFSLTPLTYAAPIGLLAWFAMGVDFPESPRRMSRLA